MVIGLIWRSTSFSLESTSMLCLMPVRSLKTELFLNLSSRRTFFCCQLQLGTILTCLSRMNPVELSTAIKSVNSEYLPSFVKFQPTDVVFSNEEWFKAYRSRDTFRKEMSLFILPEAVSGKKVYTIREVLFLLKGFRLLICTSRGFSILEQRPMRSKRGGQKELPDAKENVAFWKAESMKTGLPSLANESQPCFVYPLIVQLLIQPRQHRYPSHLSLVYAKLTKTDTFSALAVGPLVMVSSYSQF